MTTTISRRFFVGGLLATPAIVSATSLMPISAPWTLLQEVRVGQKYTPWVVRYWSRNGVIRAETETLWYGHREWDRARSLTRPDTALQETSHD